VIIEAYFADKMFATPRPNHCWSAFSASGSTALRLDDRRELRADQGPRADLD
jgi:hypothetical protein